MKYSRIIPCLSLSALALLAVSCKSKQGDPYANSNPYYGPQGAYGDNTTVEPVSDSGGYVAPAPAEPTYSAPPSAPARSSGGGGGGSKNYTVVSGDNLYRISLRHGTTVNAIKNANGLSSDVIQTGQRLRIP